MTSGIAQRLAGKRIGLLSSWVSRSNGGVFEAVIRQAEILRRLGATPVVLGLRDGASDEDRWRLGEAEVQLATVRGPAAAGYAPALAPLLYAAKLDMLHCHGIWQHHVAAAGQWSRATGKPLIMSPHGMLDPWITRRNRWKKQLARALWEARTWRTATLFHALTADEKSDIENAAGTVKTTVIANPAPQPSLAALRFPPPVALYLGRIHEKKNIGALVEGWRQAWPRLPDRARLIIAGWGDDAGVMALEKELGGASDDIRFVGTAFGSQKAALLATARFLVLPSLSEGLPMAILEGWAAGVPAIMSRHCHLPEGFAAGAALECTTDPHGIAAALDKGFAMTPGEWLAMADAARMLAEGPFGEAAIASRWGEVYSALLAA